MEDIELKRYLNALFARCIVLECQILSLRRILTQAQLVDDGEVEVMIAKCVDANADALSHKSSEEKHAAFLRSFEGPVQ